MCFPGSSKISENFKADFELCPREASSNPAPNPATDNKLFFNKTDFECVSTLFAVLCFLFSLYFYLD